MGADSGVREPPRVRWVPTQESESPPGPLGARSHSPPGMGPWCALWVVLTLLRAVQDKTSTSVAASGTPSLLDFQKDQVRSHGEGQPQGGGSWTGRPSPGPTAGERGSGCLQDRVQGGSLQFQGEWYVVGLAGNAFRKEDRELLNPYTATFELTGNGHIQVSYAMTRGQRCVTWAYTLNPASQPGHFEVDKSRDPQADSEEVQVTDSDYTTFGLMLSRRNSMGRIILRITLLGEPPGRGAVGRRWGGEEEGPLDSPPHRAGQGLVVLTASGRSWTLRPEALDKFICLVRAHHLSDEQIVFPAVIGHLSLATSSPHPGTPCSRPLPKSPHPRLPPPNPQPPCPQPPPLYTA
ncbi:epididymal-specific lipocalin-12-like [Loxodonta africana]|uniref:epididymal-specific lipocalin-12-like n=1 Tax=Loxodonta africana TaxID=9785 RepID=UPI0030CDEFFB